MGGMTRKRSRGLGARKKRKNECQLPKVQQKSKKNANSS